jgi:hypothetical protein
LLPSASFASTALSTVVAWAATAVHKVAAMAARTLSQGRVVLKAILIVPPAVGLAVGDGQ